MMKIKYLTEPPVGGYALIDTKDAHLAYAHHIEGWYLTSNKDSDWALIPQTWEEITKPACFVWVVPAMPTAER